MKKYILIVNVILCIALLSCRTSNEKGQTAETTKLNAETCNQLRSKADSFWSDLAKQGDEFLTKFLLFIPKEDGRQLIALQKTCLERSRKQSESFNRAAYEQWKTANSEVYKYFHERMSKAETTAPYQTLLKDLKTWTLERETESSNTLGLLKALGSFDEAGESFSLVFLSRYYICDDKIEHTLSLLGKNESTKLPHQWLSALSLPKACLRVEQINNYKDYIDKPATAALRSFLKKQ